LLLLLWMWRHWGDGERGEPGRCSYWYSPTHAVQTEHSSQPHVRAVHVVPDEDSFWWCTNNHPLCCSNGARWRLGKMLRVSKQGIVVVNRVNICLYNRTWRPGNVGKIDIYQENGKCRENLVMSNWPLFALSLGVHQRFLVDYGPCFFGKKFLLSKSLWTFLQRRLWCTGSTVKIFLEEWVSSIWGIYYLGNAACSATESPGKCQVISQCRVRTHPVSSPCFDTVGWASVRASGL